LTVSDGVLRLGSRRDRRTGSQAGQHPVSLAR
jgi:hypothetical protein